MTDYVGALRDDGFERTALVAAPITAALREKALPAPIFLYLMRGWRPNSSNFETWVAENTPNTNNPSGETIQNITILSKWIGT